MFGKLGFTIWEFWDSENLDTMCLGNWEFLIVCLRNWDWGFVNSMFGKLKWNFGTVCLGNWDRNN